MEAFTQIPTLLAGITQAIAGRQNRRDGGWLDSPFDPNQVLPYRESNSWDSAETIYWLLRSDHQIYMDQITRGLRFLATTQHIKENGGNHDGGWGWRKNERSDATATAWALLAFLEHHQVTQITGALPGRPDPYLPSMKRARDWLISHIHQDGGAGLYRHSSAFNTCWACIALDECMSIDELAHPGIKAGIIRHALEFVESKSAGGGWGDILVRNPDPIGTAYCTYLLLRLKKFTKADQGLLWLRNNQSEATGCWYEGSGQEVEATAWATIALLEAEEAPDSPNIERAIQFLLNLYQPNRGWPATPGDNPLLYTTLYTCFALDRYIQAVHRTQHREPSIKVLIIDPENQGNDLKEFIEGDLHLSVAMVDGISDKQGGSQESEHSASQEQYEFCWVVYNPKGQESQGATAIIGLDFVLELGHLMKRFGQERIGLIGKTPIEELPVPLKEIMVVDLSKKGWKEQVIKAFRKVGLMEEG